MILTHEPCDRYRVMRYATLATLLISVSIASADKRRDDQTHVRAEAPPPPPKPKPASVTLTQGVVAGSLAIEMSVSKDNVLAPASVAPDVSYGVTDDFTIGIIHSGSALTGFRGSAGWGVCVSGEDRACRYPYTAGGIEGIYALTRGPAALGVNAGLLFTSVDPTVHTDLKLGLKLKMSEGNVYALFSPNVWFALDDRFDRVVPHEHQLWLPVSLWVKADPKLALGIGTGVKGPLKKFADRMSIPLGALAQYTIEPRISVGASLVFGKILAGSDVMDPGINARVVQVWINLTSS
jgi:hypothetical protein